MEVNCNNLLIDILKLFLPVFAKIDVFMLISSLADLTSLYPSLAHKIPLQDPYSYFFQHIISELSKI